MMEKRKVLGRGLDTLLPSRQPPSTNRPADATTAKRSATGGGVDRPQPLPDPHPCGRAGAGGVGGFDQGDRSIAADYGSGGSGRALPAHRRRKALAGVPEGGEPTVPAIVRQVSNEQAMEMTIIENLQREDLNPIEQARAFDRLGREFGLTQEQISLRTGKERSSVANFLRLLRLPQVVQAWVAGGHSQLRPCQGADWRWTPRGHADHGETRGGKVAIGTANRRRRRRLDPSRGQGGSVKQLKELL